MRNDFQAAIMKCRKEREHGVQSSLLEVSKRFTKTLKLLSPEEIADVQEKVVDVMLSKLPVSSSDKCQNLRSMYHLIKLLADTFEPQESIDQPNTDEDQVVISNLPFFSTPAESLANEVDTYIGDSAKTKKELILLARRSLDVMRMAHSTLVDYSDVGAKHPKDIPLRRWVVMKVLKDAVFSDGIARFETQACSKLLNDDEKEWITTTASKGKFPAVSSE